MINQFSMNQIILQSAKQTGAGIEIVFAVLVNPFAPRNFSFKQQFLGL